MSPYTNHGSDESVIMEEVVCFQSLHLFQILSGKTVRIPDIIKEGAGSVTKNLEKILSVCKVIAKLIFNVTSLNQNQVLRCFFVITFHRFDF